MYCCVYCSAVQEQCYISFVLFTFPSASCWIFLLFLNWLPCHFYRCVIVTTTINAVAGSGTKIYPNQFCRCKKKEECIYIFADFRELSDNLSKAYAVCMHHSTYKKSFVYFGRRVTIYSSLLHHGTYFGAFRLLSRNVLKSDTS